MNRYSDLRSLAAVAMITLSAGSNARADETLKFRAIMHATSVQSQEVGDVDGHLSGVARFSGLASFSDGSLGTTYFVASTDYIKGAGMFSVYQNLTLNDGSILRFNNTGTATVDGTTTALRAQSPFSAAKADLRVRKETARSPACDLRLLQPEQTFTMTSSST
jgi:hypothetical protein